MNMIKFEKLDKNGVIRYVEITPSRFYDDRVVLRVLENPSISKSKFYQWAFGVDRVIKDQIYLSMTKSLQELKDFTCSDYEIWADQAINEYNQYMIEQQENEKVLKIIEKGCCN